MATEHKEAPADVAAAVLVDADLAIFAAPRPRFDEYERGIRQEHGWMPDGDFAASRRAVLERFLVRPRIYTTDFFYDRYEAAARRNLAWSANRLML
jgi:predicted metal-dependent HD superfamily phosphohydrolase